MFVITFGIYHSYNYKFSRITIKHRCPCKKKMHCKSLCSFALMPSQTNFAIAFLPALPIAAMNFEDCIILYCIALY